MVTGHGKLLTVASTGLKNVELCHLYDILVSISAMSNGHFMEMRTQNVGLERFQQHKQ